MECPQGDRALVVGAVLQVRVGLYFLLGWQRWLSAALAFRATRASLPMSMTAHLELWPVAVRALVGQVIALDGSQIPVRDVDVQEGALEGVQQLQGRAREKAQRRLDQGDAELGGGRIVLLRPRPEAVERERQAGDALQCEGGGRVGGPRR